MPVPLVDLSAEYRVCREAIDANLRAVIERTAFIGGEMVRAFEEEMAARQEVDGAVSVGSGTAALALALRALGVEKGAEVVTTPCTAAPTAEAVTLAGGRVVFADIRPGTCHLDPARAEEAVTPRTRALLLVHLYGIPCAMEPFADLARRHGLALLEDCAQAQGARYRGVRAGNFGDAACFSFFPSKTLGAFGDGGAATARDPAVLERVRCLANHGRAGKHVHVLEGVNSRLDGIQAAVLRAKLAHLDARNALRRRAAGWYFEELGGVRGLALPSAPAEAEPVWHLFPVRVEDRDGLAKALQAQGIETGIHYARALHLQPAYAYLGRGAGSFPEAEAAFREELSLPIFPSITRAQVAEVARAVRVHIGS
ncbi:MAG: DegT/DnrJ/EryC1/StrS family aminotransferase [Planctomycetota bacterium]